MWAQLSWVGSESSWVHTLHAELEKVKLIKLCETVGRCVGYSWPFRSSSGPLSQGRAGGGRVWGVEERLDGWRNTCGLLGSWVWLLDDMSFVEPEEGGMRRTEGRKEREGKEREGGASPPYSVVWPRPLSLEDDHIQFATCP